MSDIPNPVELMKHAIEVARKGIAAGQSPFGAVVATKQGQVVFAAHNRVRADCDVTAHAEVLAIRGACAKLGTIDLSGHVIAATCEPCPMCAAAVHWARIGALVYGADIADAKGADFNELSLAVGTLYELGGCRVRIYPHVMREECVGLFELWKRGPNPTPY